MLTREKGIIIIYIFIKNTTIHAHAHRNILCNTHTSKEEEEGGGGGAKKLTLSAERCGCEESRLSLSLITAYSIHSLMALNL